MPSFVYSPGSPGNVFSDAVVLPSATIAAFLDVSAFIEAQFVFEFLTGPIPPTKPTTFYMYKVFGQPNTVAATASPGATTLYLESDAGIQVGQQLCLRQSTGALFSEIVTVTGAATGTGPYAVSVTATVNAYAANDPAYLVPTAPLQSFTPGPTTGYCVANTLYSRGAKMGPSQWVVTASNPSTFVGFSLSVVAWGDGSTVPTTGASTVILGIDDSNILHIRIFYLNGAETDTDETRISSSEASQIAAIKAQIPGWLPPNAPTPIQQAETLDQLSAILSLSPVGAWVTCDGITNLQ